VTAAKLRLLHLGVQPNTRRETWKSDISESICTATGGFPWDPRLWFAFALHDIGYLRPHLDGKRGGITNMSAAARLMFSIRRGDRRRDLGSVHRSLHADSRKLAQSG
jgi:hypothetical protein